MCVCGPIWPIPGALESWRPRRRWWYQPQRPAMPSGWSKNGQRGAKTAQNSHKTGGRFAPNQQLPGPLTHVSRAPMMSTDGTSRAYHFLRPHSSGVGPFLQNIAENSNFAKRARRETVFRPKPLGDNGQNSLGSCGHRVPRSPAKLVRYLEETDIEPCKRYEQKSQPKSSSSCKTRLLASMFVWF